MTGAHHLAELVSYHAVMRYVQRVVGVVVPHDGLRPPEAAEAHCRAAGLTIDEVKARVMTPAVALAATIGAEQVGTADFKARLAPNGVVVTVTEPLVGKRKKLRILSKRELHRKKSGHGRRIKRKPAVTP